VEAAFYSETINVAARLQAAANQKTTILPDTALKIIIVRCHVQNIPPLDHVKSQVNALQTHNLFLKGLF
jgi:class 3 adenylate cyclase